MNMFLSLLAAFCPIAGVRMCGESWLAVPGIFIPRYLSSRIEYSIRPDNFPYDISSVVRIFYPLRHATAIIVSSGLGSTLPHC